MPLENLTGSNVFITNLVPSNPAGTDPVSEGDQHIGGTKNALLNSFPNINGAVTATPAQLNQLSPAGGAALTGEPTAPTAADGTNNKQIATTEFVAAASSYVFESAAALMIGVNQTWKNVTGSRVAGTTYTNNSGRPITIWIEVGIIGNSGIADLTVSGIAFGIKQAFTNNPTSENFGPVVIPNGGTYVLALSQATITKWLELT